MKQYQHIFFDLDHTLWDFEVNSRATVLRLFAEFNLAEVCKTTFEAFYDKYNYHNNRLWERFRKGYIRREELRWKRMWLTLLDFKVASTSLANEMAISYLEILPVQTALMPGARDVLEYCSGKYTLHIITNGFETTQQLKLQYTGIGKYFSNMITSEKSNSLKPQREIFDCALQLAQATADLSIMIGDGLEIDVAGAMNAGWDQVYFNPGKLQHERKPTYEIHHLSELLNIL
jgi:putative hydrolase of the HAD superfamily